MAKFKHKNGGIAEVFSPENLRRLRSDPNYTEIGVAKETPKKTKKHIEPVQVDDAHEVAGE